MLAGLLAAPWPPSLLAFLARRGAGDRVYTVPCHLPRHALSGPRIVGSTGSPRICGCGSAGRRDAVGTPALGTLPPPGRSFRNQWRRVNTAAGPQQGRERGPGSRTSVAAVVEAAAMPVALPRDGHCSFCWAFPPPTQVGIQRRGGSDQLRGRRPPQWAGRPIALLANMAVLGRALGRERSAQRAA